MTFSMRAKYDKYFGNFEKINPLLFVGNVLDPQFKLEYGTWSIEDTCTKDLAANMPNLNLKGSKFQDVVQNKENAWKKQKRAKTSFEKTDLKKYLAEDIVDDEDNFDILDWWKTNASKYRILYVMERDVFAISVSTIASTSFCFVNEKLSSIFDVGRGNSRSGEAPIAQARNLSLKRGSYSLDRSKMSLFSPKQDSSRSSEATLAQARQLSLKRESFSIAQDFTLQSEPFSPRRQSLAQARIPGLIL
ncbi:hypothetical protein Lal_00036675 [Lupinus albus]|nr:hypothetical protein Lal_00036675 [Lupinus albus]